MMKILLFLVIIPIPYIIGRLSLTNGKWDDGWPTDFGDHFCYWGMGIMLDFLIVIISVVIYAV